jgi:hypothetical protein
MMLLSYPDTDTMLVMPSPRRPESTLRSPIVDWSVYADGKMHPLRQGKHFAQSPYLARKAFIAWCSRQTPPFHTHTVLGEGRAEAWIWVQAYNDQVPPVEDVI